MTRPAMTLPVPAKVLSLQSALPSVLVKKGDRLWSVFDQRWVSMSESQSCDLGKAVLLVPPRVRELERARTRRGFVQRARRRRRQIAFAVVQATLAASIGFIVGTAWLFC